MDETQERRFQEVWRRRFAAWGAEESPLAGGSALVGTLALGGTRLEGGLSLASIRFAPLDLRRIKLFSPAPLFQLGPLDVAACTDAAGVEAKLREAWAARVAAVRKRLAALAGIGVAARPEAGGALLAFPIGLDGPEACARSCGSARVALPTGPLLSQPPAARAADRIAEIRADAESASDVEIALTTVLEARARAAEEHAARLRRGRSEQANALPERHAGRRPTAATTHRILLVGPHLERDPALARELRRRGFEVEIARGLDEAVAVFRNSTHEVVLAEAELGRSEGLELVPALDELPGIGRVPVVLLDEQARPARREAAKKIGAAGYLAGQLDVARVAPGLQRMARGSRGRRYLRVAHRLAVDFGASGDTGVAVALSRLGMFVRTERDATPGRAERCVLTLPEAGRALPIEGEVVYSVPAAGERTAGLGIRFARFEADGERTWIDYLGSLLEAERGNRSARA